MTSSSIICGLANFRLCESTNINAVIVRARKMGGPRFTAGRRCVQSKSRAVGNLVPGTRSEGAIGDAVNVISQETHRTVAEQQVQATWMATRKLGFIRFGSVRTVIHKRHYPFGAFLFIRVHTGPGGGLASRRSF